MKLTLLVLVASAALLFGGLVLTAPAQAVAPAAPAVHVAPAAVMAATVGCEYQFPRWTFQPGWTIHAGDCYLTDGGYLIMLPDGDLAIYDRNWNRECASDTSGHPGAFAAFQHDGNFVIYYNGGPIAGSGTMGNPDSEMWFRVSGRLQIRTAEGTIWDMCRD